MKFKARYTIAAAILACTAFFAQAAPLTWTLGGVTFDDGATASGSFNWDASTNTMGAFSISTTSGVLTPYLYDGSSSTFFGANILVPNDMWWVANDFSRYFDLGFATALTDAGGTVALSTGGYPVGGFECDNCTRARSVTAGYATALAPVPEPETYGMMLAGLGLIGAIARRKKKSIAA